MCSLPPLLFLLFLLLLLLVFLTLFFCCRYASREWFNNSAASFFMPRLFLHTTLTCNIDSHTLSHTHTHSCVMSRKHPHTQTLTSLHGPQRKHDVTTLSFLLFSVYLANYSPLFFPPPPSPPVSFFFVFLSFLLLWFIYNSKNKSFSSRFYIRHLQVQCVTCPSYKVHLYFLNRLTPPRHQLRRKKQ